MSYWTQQKEMKVEDFDFMADEFESTEFSAWDFLHGFCACFAYAYVIKYGGTIVKLRNKEFPNIHCYVKIEKGGEIYYVDIRGKIKSEEELLCEFELSYQDLGGFYDFYSDIWVEYEWKEFHTPNQLKYFYNHFVIQNKKALADAKKFLKANREFYV